MTKPARLYGAVGALITVTTALAVKRRRKRKRLSADLIDEQDMSELIGYAKWIAQIYIKHSVDCSGIGEFNRQSGINTLLGLTENGLILEYRDDRPLALLTPLGRWTFAPAAPNWLDLKGFESALKLREIPVVDSGYVLRGPFYAVVAILGCKLPKAKMKHFHQQHVDGPAAHEMWDSLYHIARIPS